MGAPGLILFSLLLLGSASVFAADLTLTVAPRWKTETLAIPSATVANDAGQSLRFTRLSLLLSGVTLLRADGSSVRLDGQFGVVDAESGRWTFTVRGVPEGEFVGLEFNVGVPPNVNHADPGRWPAGHALNPLVNGLHWSWQGGYVFAAIEGRWSHSASAAVASAADPTAENVRGFSYHLATDARLMAARFRANFQIADDTTVELALDLARMLGARRLDPDDGSESTHSAAGDELAPQLAVAFERAWFLLQAVPTLTRRTTEDDVARRVSGGTATPLAFTTPAGFPQPALPADNPLTVEGVALGEALFIDRRLSATGTQSCASCHAPERAFSDSVALSRGAEGTAGRRNAMPLFNLAWSPAYAWDGSQPRIRDQALAAWTNPIEMHADLAVVVAALSRDDGLVAKFQRTFGTPEITVERVTLALEQYLLTLVAADSKFDRALRGAAELTTEEKRGFELFATEYDPARDRRGADCFHCHGGALFTDFAMKNNGLDLAAIDAGRARTTARDTDAGKFKTPSLRNVAVTAPYMHDGRFATLEDVVAHYDHGVQRAATLDPNLAKHPAAGLALSAEDQHALIAFLRTLTDQRFEVAQASRLPP